MVCRWPRNQALRLTAVSGLVMALMAGSVGRDPAAERVVRASALSGPPAEPVPGASDAAPVLVPSPQEMEWVGSLRPVPRRIEVRTDPATAVALAGALEDFLPRIWAPADQPLLAPAYDQSGRPYPAEPVPSGAVQVRPWTGEPARPGIAVRTAGPGMATGPAGPESDERGTPASGREVLMVLVNLARFDGGALPDRFEPDPVLGLVLSSLPRERLAALPAEAYHLTSRTLPDGRAVVVAASRSDRGLMYAALTWAALAHQVQGFPLVTVTDWPSFPVRGVIEGFYGPPWSPADRLNQVAFYPWVKFNTYVYAPKDDPYHREKWRVLYPAEELERLKSLVDLAHRYQVDLVFAISPGLSVVFSSDSDLAALVAKTEQMRAIGIHRFALLLDDIPKALNSPVDREKFKNDVGAAQAYLVNRYAAYLREKEPGHPLIVVPTEYYDLANTAYKRSFASRVAADVIIYWTGVGVVAPVVSSEQAAAAGRLWQHPILMWDNYPVNDYARHRLFLGPLAGREDRLAELGPSFLGFTFNPMNEAEASKLPLITAAGYAWNAGSYQPKRAWEAALVLLVPPAARHDLELLARHYWMSELNREDPLQDEVQRWLMGRARVTGSELSGSGESAGAAREAEAYFAALEGLVTLPERLKNPRLASELAPYVEALALAGRLARDYYRLVDLARAGDEGKLEAEKEWQVRADWLTRFSYWQTLDHPMGGPLDEILSQVSARVGEPLWLVSGRGIRAETSLAAYETFTVDRMLDGRDDTFFWSNRGPGAGDWIGLDLGRVVPVQEIYLEMGSTSGSFARPNDYLAHFEIRISADGETWQKVGRYDGLPRVRAELPPGTMARYVRAVAVARQTNWVQVREFGVRPRPAAFDLSVDGLEVVAQAPEPAATAGVTWGQGPGQSPLTALPLRYESEIGAVLDGNPATAVRLVPGSSRGHTEDLAATLTVRIPGDLASTRWEGIALLLGPGDETKAPGTAGQPAAEELRDGFILSLEITEDGENWTGVRELGAGAPPVAASAASSGGELPSRAVVVRFERPRVLAGYRLAWRRRAPENAGLAGRYAPVPAPLVSVREFYPLPAAPE